MHWLKINVMTNFSFLFFNQVIQWLLYVSAVHNEKKDDLYSPFLLIFSGSCFPFATSNGLVTIILHVKKACHSNWL